MRITIHPTAYLYLIAITVFSSWKTCLSVLSALLVHEAAHYGMSILVGDRIECLELTPVGGVMTYASGKSPKKGISGICVSVAGPMGNYIMILAVLHTPLSALEFDMQRSIVSANFAMMCINMIPVLPLDGGRMVYCAGYYFFRISALVSVLTCGGMICGTGFLFMAIYGLYALHELNCSLVMIGVFLMLSAKKSRAGMIAENLYAILQEIEEEPAGVQRIRMYRVSSATPLYSILGRFSGGGACVFEFEDDQGIHRIDEREIGKAALISPYSTIGDIMKHKELQKK